MKRTIMLAALAVALIGPAGCWGGGLRKSVDPATELPPPAEAAYLKQIPPTQEEKLAKPTAVESALIWSEKYSQAIDQCARQDQANKELAAENRQLKAQTGKSETDLAKAQQELSDANALLIQTRQELKKWQTDVLGFRDEMRRAQATELEALVKVLNLLGGEVPPLSAATGSRPVSATTSAVTQEARNAKGENTP